MFLPSVSLPSALVELAALERLNPKLVARELQPLIKSLRARVKVCYRCGTETIGKYRPKRGQRTFHSRECSAAQAREDFLARESGAASTR